MLLERLVSLAGRADPGKLDSMFDQDVVTVDPDATKVATYGKAKQGSKFSYNFSGTCLHPIVGVIGETGHVLAVRSRGGNASPRSGLGSFTRTASTRSPTSSHTDARRGSGSTRPATRPTSSRPACSVRPGSR